MGLFDNMEIGKAEKPGFRSNSDRSIRDDGSPEWGYREFEIEKKGKGKKMRKIVAPGIERKGYLTKRLPKLYKLFDRIVPDVDLQDRFHGFLPKRNAVTAAMSHRGFDVTLTMDISNFFDSINTSFFKFDDRIKLELKDEMFHKEKYTPQGFPTSPILCNIALIPILYSLRINLPSKVWFTIYADDIQLSFSEEVDWRNIRQIVTNVFEKHNLQINEKKTRVRFAKYGARKVLGINVWEDRISATRRTNRKVRGVRKKVIFQPEIKQSLGGLVTWQKSKLPKGVLFVL